MVFVNKLISSHKDYKINALTAKIILISPIVISLFFGTLLIIHATRLFGLSLLEENQPVELLTFILFLFGGIYGFKFLFKVVKLKRKLTFFFYLIFSIALVFLAFEEIAWGQWFFSFDTPEYWQKINVQEETTLHNLKGIQGNTELLRFLFGVGGICGIFLRSLPNFNDIKVPLFLIFWFVIIMGHPVLDFISDYIKLDDGKDFAFSKFSEVVELLISMSACLYLILNNRRINV